MKEWLNFTQRIIKCWYTLSRNKIEEKDRSIKSKELIIKELISKYRAQIKKLYFAFII